MKKSDVVVVGGGASGLTAAILAAARGYKVRVLERLPKCGKKILATGNGKCNMTNLREQKDSYRGRELSFSKEVLQCFSVGDALHFFEGLGLLWKERDGYVYPYAEQATAVLNALELKLQALRVPIDCSQTVKTINKTKKGFLIETENEKYQAAACILACGGQAQPKLGSDGSGYTLARSLGHHVYPPIPALTALHTSHSAKKEWSGVRVQGKVLCFVNGKKVAKDQGELQLTAYGISGVPIFQISRYAAEGLFQKQKVRLQLDFFPEKTMEQFQADLIRLIKSCSYKNIRELLEGIFPKKLVPVFLKEAKLKNTLHGTEIREKDMQELCRCIKNFSLPITDCNGFEQCQVCAGGVDVREIHVHTMESMKVTNLYITGELLDIEGKCGGYNLQWAWATGWLAGQAVLSK